MVRFPFPSFGINRPSFFVLVLRPAEFTAVRLLSRCSGITRLVLLQAQLGTLLTEFGIDPTASGEPSDAGWTFRSLHTRRIPILASTNNLLAPPCRTATQHPSRRSSCFTKTGDSPHSQLQYIPSSVPASTPALDRLGLRLESVLHTAFWTRLPRSDRAFSDTEHTFRSIVVTLYPTTRTAHRSVEGTRVGTASSGRDLFARTSAIGIML